ncbi:hypothetical protein A3E15_03680 [Candidatus Woesebacteria bacterium RIFCSPHIGHO2_12_FULL_42_9]|uniref:Glycosyltransferase 2-like domain-containing protein n=2 Tax=Candidatus Woeseibacteriota TaxID=1752722 RepID=A0A1F8AWH6_9BACT|nr:MAG: hypothetical protein A2112_00025 [Candidatus Woesebacteria bacterium GWA1_42_12]OGM56087.1 MAG: hypothetical protein A3E15_03680 [Candidatus Woesebacteria bacterium RIFCSPHIGHO2_12_FULL_42_9]
MPVLNEEAYIENSILSWTPIITSFPGSEIMIIDGGSKDKTKEKLEKLRKKLKFLKLVDQIDKGHGNALIQGYNLAVNSAHSWVFQTDGDGHHNPSDFEALWVKRTKSDFVLGHRKRRQDPAYRLVIAKLVSLAILILFGVYIKDPNIPFRLMRRDFLKKILKHVPKGVFAPNIFLSILAKKNGHNLYHIPVTHTNRKKATSNTRTVLKGASRSFLELLLFALA